MKKRFSCLKERNRLLYPSLYASSSLEYVFNYNFPLIPLPPSEEDYFVALGNESWLARGSPVSRKLGRLVSNWSVVIQLSRRPTTAR